MDDKLDFPLEEQGMLHSVRSSLDGDGYVERLLQNCHGLFEGRSLGLAGGDQASSVEVALGLGRPLEGAHRPLATSR